MNHEVQILENSIRDINDLRDLLMDDNASDRENPFHEALMALATKISLVRDQTFRQNRECSEHEKIKLSLYFYPKEEKNMYEVCIREILMTFDPTRMLTTESPKNIPVLQCRSSKLANLYPNKIIGVPIDMSVAVDPKKDDSPTAQDNVKDEIKELQNQVKDLTEGYRQLNMIVHEMQLQKNQPAPGFNYKVPLWNVAEELPAPNARVLDQRPVHAHEVGDLIFSTPEFKLPGFSTDPSTELDSLLTLINSIIATMTKSTRKELHFLFFQDRGFNISDDAINIRIVPLYVPVREMTQERIQAWSIHVLTMSRTKWDSLLQGRDYVVLRTDTESVSHVSGNANRWNLSPSERRRAFGEFVSGAFDHRPTFVNPFDPSIPPHRREFIKNNNPTPPSSNVTTFLPEILFPFDHRHPDTYIHVVDKLNEKSDWIAAIYTIVVQLHHEISENELHAICTPIKQMASDVMRTGDVLSLQGQNFIGIRIVSYANKTYVHAFLVNGDLTHRMMTCDRFRTLCYVRVNNPKDPSPVYLYRL